jgi:hypothetical protein
VGRESVSFHSGADGDDSESGEKVGEEGEGPDSGEWESTHLDLGFPGGP